MNVSRGQIWISLVMLFVAAVLLGNMPQVEAAKKVVLYPYKMVVEKAGGTYFDSTIMLTDNEDYVTGHPSKQIQGFYTHTWRTDHRDSGALALVWDTTDFYFDIKDYDAGAIGYGISDYTVTGDDSTTHFWLVTAALGTEMGGLGFVPIRYISLKEHGIAGTGANTYTDTLLGEGSMGHKDSLALVNISKNLVGGTDADSSWMRVCDKLRLRILDKDSSQVLDKIGLVRHTFNYRAFMLVREEY